MVCERGYLRWDIHTVGSGRISSFLPHRRLIPFRGSWGEEFTLSPGGRPPHLKSWRAQVGQNPESPPATSSILLPVPRRQCQFPLRRKRRTEEIRGGRRSRIRTSGFRRLFPPLSPPISPSSCLPYPPPPPPHSFQLPLAVCPFLPPLAAAKGEGEAGPPPYVCTPGPLPSPPLHSRHSSD